MTVKVEMHKSERVTSPTTGKCKIGTIKGEARQHLYELIIPRYMCIFNRV